MAELIYLGMGSNVGDRMDWLRRALVQLGAAGLRVLRVSSVYETEPVGRREQPWFLNCVVEAVAEEPLDPQELLRRLHAIEHEAGRRRTKENEQGPRTLDLDIVLWGERQISLAGLQVPHARFRQRRFVLAPLAELNPELRDPATGKSISALLQRAPRERVRRFKEGLVGGAGGG